VEVLRCEDFVSGVEEEEEGEEEEEEKMKKICDAQIGA
jgi:hypothetical protein